MNHTKIAIETTPNPATMKFKFPFQVTDSGFECGSAQDTDRSPLAAKIFGFPWTASVYIGPDFVSVTKQDWVEWNYLAEPLAGLIQEHVDSSQPIIVEYTAKNDEDVNDSPVVKQIKSLLNHEIRPVVALDGGDIVFSHYEDNVVYLHMKGSCAGCPSSTATLKDGIEVRLKEAIPEIKEVVSI
jgi:Fe-S cluster biogenesis protein NfuA